MESNSTAAPKRDPRASTPDRWRRVVLCLVATSFVAAFVVLWHFLDAGSSQRTGSAHSTDPSAHAASGKQFLLSYVTQAEWFDYGETGMSGGLRHFEEQLLCPLESIAAALGRRLVLLPPAQLLDASHLSGDESHGWNIVYDRPYDDPVTSSWEVLVRPEHGLWKEVVSVDAENVADLLRNSQADLLILQQWATPSRPWYSGQAIDFVKRAVLGTLGNWLVDAVRTAQQCPPPPSRYLTDMGDRVRSMLGSYVTIHVRRGDVARRRQLKYLKRYSAEEIDEATTPDRIIQVLRQQGVSPADTVLLFTNEHDQHYFDAVCEVFPKTLREQDVVELIASAYDGFGDGGPQMSWLSSGTFRLQLDTYLAGYGTRTICTAAPKMHAHCDAYLVLHRKGQ